jgi:hypothetical protein
MIFKTIKRKIADLKMYIKKNEYPEDLEAHEAMENVLENLLKYIDNPIDYLYFCGQPGRVCLLLRRVFHNSEDWINRGILNNLLPDNHLHPTYHQEIARPVRPGSGSAPGPDNFWDRDRIDRGDQLLAGIYNFGGFLRVGALLSLPGFKRFGCPEGSFLCSRNGHRSFYQQLRHWNRRWISTLGVSCPVSGISSDVYSGWDYRLGGNRGSVAIA